MSQNETTVPDEFWNGIWWRPDGDGRLRNASARECATEIQRLRSLAGKAARFITNGNPEYAKELLEDCLDVE